MSANDEQVEELEVLSSIFEDDKAYSQVSDSCIQYKIGEHGSYKSFVIEFLWPKDYPHCLPEINLNVFYNKEILPEVKQIIIESLNNQAQSMIGEAMTYSLIDFAKENQDELMANQPKATIIPTESKITNEKKKKEKKEQLTKAQKRRLGDRFGANKDRPRGWDWVDIIKHLSQTGRMEDGET